MTFSVRTHHLSAPDFTPRLEVDEQDNTIVVTNELPGLKEDEVQVDLNRRRW
jgi:HSP20 family molecular chaperone IbpA